MTRLTKIILGSAALIMGLGLTACDQPKNESSQRVTIRYWDKWNGFEAEAMRAVVDDFNASQDRIFVDYSSVSQIDRKMMLSTAGGVPPDVAGIWSQNISVLAENNALTPLDPFAREAGVTREQYIDVFWRMCCYRDHLWALPSTPISLALIWNKKMFRAAGLDPERPPRSIAELEQFNQRLMKLAPDGSLEQIGHLPQVPGWNSAYWELWFGGKLSEGREKITATTPANVAAYQWVESYPKRFGGAQMLALRDGFGNSASPQDPFFTGKVAMVLQGPWIYNFIKNYAPADFEWGVAAFPSVDPERLQNVTTVSCDALVIPHGARHPQEAFEFIRYVNAQAPMEKLCLAQRKFSPLAVCSPDFVKNHPNPAIGIFLELAKSPNASFAPQLSTFTEYMDDLQNAVNEIVTGNATAVDALQAVQDRQQGLLDRKLRRWERLAPELTAEWAQP